MGLKKMFLLLFLVFGAASCTNPGTEVLSPPAPNQIPTVTQFNTQFYEVTLTLPPGWTYTEFGPGAAPGPGVFTDIDPSTITVAHFTKGLNRFTIFFSILPTADSFSEALFNFVRARHPTGEIVVESIPNQADAYFVSFDDGNFWDLYLSIESQCLWMRVELAGNPIEQKQTMQEFRQIVDSIEFVPK